MGADTRDMSRAPAVLPVERNTGEGLKAVLFRSEERFGSFQRKLAENGVAIDLLDFDRDRWIDYDYAGADLAIYYPTFKFSSNHPHALDQVHDNLLFLAREFPHLALYPDPRVIWYYNDKYRQYLFLKKHRFPTPETLPLVSASSLDEAESRLGFPMVLKNRHGAGGSAVFLARDRKHLEKYYHVSRLNFFRWGSVRYGASLLSRRTFYYHLIRMKKAPYPFLSPPLLAQKFLHIDRDLKTVVGDGRVVEGHWRLRADRAMWKMNIDGGGIGEWSRIPREAIDLSVRLAGALQASWLNLDLIPAPGEFLVTEFSPVWHHYAYREKPSFVYRDDYNIEVPPEIALDLESMLVESLLARVRSSVRSAPAGI
ncbi:MAG: ATP-grasp domain-containing protein [bacterium]